MIANIATAILFVAGSCAVVRLVRGPTLADRVIALDVALVVLMATIVTRAADSGETAFLPTVAVIAIVGFTATIALTRFIEKTGQP